jgi:hypothetical protein
MLPLLSVATWLLATNPALEEGRTLYQSLRYERAAEKLLVATQAPEATREERLESYDLLARSLAALGRMKEVQDTYRQLLLWEPQAPLPRDAAPKIREAFLRAKEGLYRRDYVELQQQQAPPGQLAVRLVDPWAQVKALRMQVRGPQGFTPVPLPRDRSGARTELPPADEDGTVSLYLEAEGQGGQVLARLGSAGQPLVFRGVPRPVPPQALPAPAPASAPVAEVQTSSGGGRAWAGWGLAGASVVAAGVGALLAVKASNDSRAAEQAPWASETRELDARARRKSLQSHFLIGGALVGGAGAVVLLTAF